MAMHVTQEDPPKLLLLDESATVSVHDGITFRWLRDVHESGPGASRLQGF